MYPGKDGESIRRHRRSERASGRVRVRNGNDRAGIGLGAFFQFDIDLTPARVQKSVRVRVVNGGDSLRDGGNGVVRGTAAEGAQAHPRSGGFGGPEKHAGSEPDRVGSSQVDLSPGVSALKSGELQREKRVALRALPFGGP